MSSTETEDEGIRLITLEMIRDPTYLDRIKKTLSSRTPPTDAKEWTMIASFACIGLGKLLRTAMNRMDGDNN